MSMYVFTHIHCNGKIMSEKRYDGHRKSLIVGSYRQYSHPNHLKAGYAKENIRYLRSNFKMFKLMREFI